MPAYPDTTNPPRTKQHASTDVLRRNASKAELYQTFAVARRNGLSISASAKAAGISRMTGTRWEGRRKAEQESENRLNLARSVIATKIETAEILSETLRTCESQYKAGVAASLARIQGYEAPQRSQIEVRQVPQSVLTWLDSVDAIDVQAESAEQIAQHTPPKALIDKASS